MEKNTYPVEEWKVTEEKFVKDWNYRNETTFALQTATLVLVVHLTKDILHGR
mgnify:CR=1 FL=1